jgi:hypothetical protein
MLRTLTELFRKIGKFGKTISERKSSEPLARL